MTEVYYILPNNNKVTIVQGWVEFGEVWVTGVHTLGLPMNNVDNHLGFSINVKHDIVPRITAIIFFFVKNVFLMYIF